VDVAGKVDATGKRVWNMGVDLADDQEIHIAAGAMQGKWYASSFPTAEFATPFDAAATLDAIYTQDDQALWLLGLASAQESPPEGKTLLVYAQPVATLRFPLTVGSSWTRGRRPAS
jgi:hypothetical protein